MSTILVLNMGMKSIRSIVFDSEGNKLSTSAKPIETCLSEECVTQNPSEWWKKAQIVIRESLLDLKDTKIDYLTVTTSSSCLVYVDEYGNDLGPCIMVSDKRAKEESMQIENSMSFVEVRKNTGLNADSYLLLPKSLWLKKHEPEIFNKVSKLLSPNDYLIAKLTGKYVTDYMNAQKWHYDIAKKRYPMELLNELEIDIDLLPTVISPGQFVGCINKEVAKELDLNEDVKVIASTYDAICSFIGSGVSDEGEASDVSGTVTVFRAVSHKKLNIEGHKIQQIPYEEGDMNIVGGSNNLGGGLIEWVKQCYYQNERLPYEQMEKDAGEASLGADGLIFLPYLLGERAPIWNYDARGVFFGLERMHTRKEMTRAVFESAGFIDLDMIAAIEENGMQVTNIRVSGGLARVNLISQIKADITGREVHVLSEFETTATGAAMIALFGQGVYNSIKEASDIFAAVRMIIKPNLKNHEKYLELYKLYKDTYQTLLPLFPKRMEITEKIYRKKQVKIENL